MDLFSETYECEDVFESSLSLRFQSISKFLVLIRNWAGWLGSGAGQSVLETD